MPLPMFLIVPAAISGVAGLVKGYEGFSDTKKANKLVKLSKDRYEKCIDALDNNRDFSNGVLEDYAKVKLNIWSTQFTRFVELFEKIKNVESSGDILKDEELSNAISSIGVMDIKKVSIKANEILKAGTASAGAGVLAGIATYGGVMTFGAASTGTAICTLSGVAATNATLAWLGGGSLAAGGLGMAGGAIVLGGLATAPFLGVGGFLFSKKSKANLAVAEKQFMEVEAIIEDARLKLSMLDAIVKLVEQYKSLANGLNVALSSQMNKLENALRGVEERNRKGFRNKILSIFSSKGIDYYDLDDKEKHVIHETVNLMLALRTLLDTPLIDEMGIITNEASELLASYEEV